MTSKTSLPSLILVWKLWLNVPLRKGFWSWHRIVCHECCLHRSRLHLYEDEFCLPKSNDCGGTEYYTFTISDYYVDGTMWCSHGVGYYRVFIDGRMIGKHGDNFTHIFDRLSFHGCVFSKPTLSPSTTQSSNPSQALPQLRDCLRHKQAKRLTSLPYEKSTIGCARGKLWWQWGYRSKHCNTYRQTSQWNFLASHQPQKSSREEY